VYDIQLHIKITYSNNIYINLVVWIIKYFFNTICNKLYLKNKKNKKKKRERKSSHWLIITMVMIGITEESFEVGGLVGYDCMSKCLLEYSKGQGR
jgi:uncharacterized membrane protein YfcA